MATRKYFLVFEHEDFGDAIAFAKRIRFTEAPSGSCTTYDSIEGLLYDYARQEGPWDPDPSKNVEVGGDSEVMPWFEVRLDAAS